MINVMTFKGFSGHVINMFILPDLVSYDAIYTGIKI